MKKLIAIFTLVALMFSLSLCALAAEGAIPVVVAPKGDGSGLYKATVDVNVGANATLLGIQGDTLKLTGGIHGDGTNIDYIDQISLSTTATSTEFEFKFRTENGLPVQGVDYTFMIGGSEGVVYKGTYKEGTSSTGFTVSGTVSNAANYDINYDSSDADLYEGFKTTVSLYLVDDFDLDAIRPSGTAVKYADVDATSKEFSITDVEAGRYIVYITRAGYLYRSLGITVSDSMSLGDLPLRAGDINQSTEVETGDTGLIYANYGASWWDNEGENDRYKYAIDLNYSLEIDTGDTGLVYANYGKSIYDYENMETIWD